MSDERNIRLVLSYDGSDFKGWQNQLNTRTVQGEIEKALARMHGHEIALTGAGRTDSGVHARAQVANFYSDIASIPAGRFRMALNSLIPKDIRITHSEEVPSAFHSRFDARSRRYRYYFSFGQTMPWHERYSWKLDRKPDIPKLNRMASCLRGELDCRAFASARDESEHFFRYLYNASFFLNSGFLVFEIEANAFLWRMVRSIVGTLIELEARGADENSMQEILQSRDRSLAGVTAPPNGLFLWHVGYYK